MQAHPTDFINICLVIQREGEYPIKTHCVQRLHYILNILLYICYIIAYKDALIGVESVDSSEAICSVFSCENKQLRFS